MGVPLVQLWGPAHALFECVCWKPRRHRWRLSSDSCNQHPAFKVAVRHHELEQRATSREKLCTHRTIARGAELMAGLSTRSGGASELLAAKADHRLCGWALGTDAGCRGCGGCASRSRGAAAYVRSGIHCSARSGLLRRRPSRAWCCWRSRCGGCLPHPRDAVHVPRPHTPCCRRLRQRKRPPPSKGRRHLLCAAVARHRNCQLEGPSGTAVRIGARRATIDDGRHRHSFTRNPQPRRSKH